MDTFWAERDSLGRLGALLRAANYRTDQLPTLLALDTSSDTVLSDIGRFSLYHLGEVSLIDDPAAVLFELFLLGGQVQAERWRLLAPELAALLVDLGLVTILPDRERRGTVAITEYQDGFFLSDRLFEHGPDGFTRDWPDGGCMPPHASSIELLRGVEDLDLPGRSFLDMGCGSGFLSQLAASGHPQRVGVDIGARSVAYATANAAINGVDARYVVGDCTTYTDPATYSRIAFNAPDSTTAFAFINTTLRDLLDQRGVAQVWFDTEITAADGSLDGLLRRMIPDRDSWHLSTATDSSSPFTLSRDMVRDRWIPPHSLLAVGRAERAAYLDALAEREVLEVQSVLLSLRAS
ncbi:MULTISPECIES: methyltransferase [Actinoalloteichus]|uniref:Methyltransferase family protein n=1 Tax=Actinoalloteichus fjordicus TaxID=1612552 RepID=A0AAC9LAK3_9PSEU|nr:MULTISPECIES: methyltransferase [Actinoalloteichus]APU13112.1 methyltransferase family protein [Actinoalloteichus fjordicus]APU19063.1 methyltransferase family protein [Actinoalloteichus sp. GBA129-24]